MKVPEGQRNRIKSILRSWPDAVRDRAAKANASFPCNVVLAISFADHAIAAHIKANPIRQSGGWASMDSAAGDVIHHEDDPNPDVRQMPGYLVDKDLRTIFAANIDNISRRDPRRRDCIGMQGVAVGALDKVAGSGLESRMLVIGNESLGRFPAKAGAYLIGADPIDNGVHHVAGLWPRLKGDDTSGAVPPYAIILDYWLHQNPAAAEAVMSKAQFVAAWDSLNRSGELRVENP